MTRHILSTYEDALDSLRADLKRMGEMTLSSFDLASRCLIEADGPACDLAITNDVEVDALEKKIDGDGIEIITRFQPVASDLRQVIAAMKIGSDLERIADLAVSIARRARKLGVSKPASSDPDLKGALSHVRAMIADSITAQRSLDVNLARSVIDRDPALDSLCKANDRSLTDVLAANPILAGDAVQIAIINRNIERMGDHAKNIAEDVIFAATAEDIRHPGK